jgi:hypothetical protein
MHHVVAPDFSKETNAVASSCRMIYPGRDDGPFVHKNLQYTLVEKRVNLEVFLCFLVLLRLVGEEGVRRGVEAVVRVCVLGRWAMDGEGLIIWVPSKRGAVFKLCVNGQMLRA